MVGKDALFFIQLLFPLHDPKHSGIEDDPRQDYYENVAMCTHIYATGKAQHGLRTHALRNTNAKDHVRWDGIVVCNTNKNMANCWDDAKKNCFDPVIADTMSFSRWQQIK